MNHFKQLYRKKIKELDTYATLYVHTPTGAQVLSMENEDENKCFGISFRTPPKDSTGVAHILEHTVLCGSRKYPVKDPFVQLLKGSLQTYLNAFTYPDKTCYPVASQNLKDFHNLVDVYLDAVFHPLITRDFFMQEGWHYELEDSSDELSIKGVVYNEMKGVYSSPDSLLAETSQHALFPDTTYGLDSGGDPRHIPELTYEEFKAFHASHYHPSNARIFFYGNDPVEDRFRILEEYLSDFTRIDPHSSIDRQTRLPQARIEKPFSVSADDPDPKPMFTCNWMLPSPTNADRVATAGLLDRILLETPASPLRRALIESGLGEDLTGGGLETHLFQMMYSIGLKGVRPENLEKAEKLVRDTFQKLAEEGVSEEDVDAALNSFEFDLRENNSGGFPRGLSVMLRALNGWIYDADPLELLAFEKPLEQLKKNAKTPGFFENLIREYFLENKHQSTVVLRPDRRLAAQIEQQEKARLAKAKSAMSADQIEEVIQTTQRLLKLQATPDRPEDLAKIPLLDRSDLDVKIRTVPREETNDSKTTILLHPLHTNGILYLDLGFNLQVLEADDIPYAALLCSSLFEMGTQKEDYISLAQRISRTTGGMYASPFLSALSEPPKSTANFFFRTKCMVPRTEEMLQILQDVLLLPDLSNQARFRQIVLEHKAEMEAALLPRGHSAVMTRLKARYNTAYWASEQMGGMDAICFLRRLADEMETDWPALSARLERIRSTLINRDALVLNLTADPQSLSQLKSTLEDFLGTLPAHPVKSAFWRGAENPKHEAFTAPTQVNFVGAASNLYDHDYTFHGSALVITRYLQTAWLWEKIRVQGGAYGAMCSFDYRSGAFIFASYRDPNLKKTLQTYQGTGGFLEKLKISETELTRALIGAIGQLDHYQLPDAKGYADTQRYLLHFSDAQRQKIRDEVLSTTPEHFHAFGKTLSAAFAQPSIAVLCSPDAAHQIPHASTIPLL